MSTLCVLSFTPIHRDARVLRQIEYLSPHYDLLVIGFGPPPPRFLGTPSIRWCSLDREPGNRALEQGSKLRKYAPAFVKLPLRPLLRLFRTVVRIVLYGVAGRFVPRFGKWLFFRNPTRQQARALIQSNNCDAIHANDWDGMPVAVEAAHDSPVRVLYDAHEYSPLQRENSWLWRVVDAPLRRHLLRTYASRVDACVTVSPSIAQRLALEYGLDPTVVLNTPDPSGNKRQRRHLAAPIRMIHHGLAAPAREPERMIRAVGLCEGHFTLDLMLLGDPDYIQRLRDLASRVASGHVHFRPPVPPDQLVQELESYDVGIFVLPENTFNHRAALPNKLFDFIAAGLAVCIGPSSEMARLVRHHGCGIVADSFDPPAVARALLAVGSADLQEMQTASSRAAHAELNARHQMGKLLRLYDQMLSGKACSRDDFI